MDKGFSKPRLRFGIPQTFCRYDPYGGNQPGRKVISAALDEEYAAMLPHLAGGGRCRKPATTRQRKNHAPSVRHRVEPAILRSGDAGVYIYDVGMAKLDVRTAAMQYRHEGEARQVFSRSLCELLVILYGCHPACIAHHRRKDRRVIADASADMDDMFPWSRIDLCNQPCVKGRLSVVDSPLRINPHRIVGIEVHRVSRRTPDIVIPPSAKRPRPAT